MVLHNKCTKSNGIFGFRAVPMESLVLVLKGPRVVQSVKELDCCELVLEMCSVRGKLLKTNASISCLCTAHLIVRYAKQVGTNVMLLYCAIYIIRLRPKFGGSDATILNTCMVVWQEEEEGGDSAWNGLVRMVYRHGGCHLGKWEVKKVKHDPQLKQ